jgi:hypothetical protein
VFKPNILYPKVINNETELDGTPFVAPEARGGFRFVISFSKKAGSEEIVGKNAGLGKATTALANFEVNPTVMLVTFKFVFLNEICRNVCNFNADMFMVRYQSIKVEVLEVNGSEMYAWQESTLMRRFKGHSVGSLITQKHMRLPPMVMQVQSGSSFSGCTSHTIMVWQISLCLLTGML